MPVCMSYGQQLLQVGLSDCPIPHTTPDLYIESLIHQSFNKVDTVVILPMTYITCIPNHSSGVLVFEPTRIVIRGAVLDILRTVSPEVRHIRLSPEKMATIRRNRSLKYFIVKTGHFRGKRIVIKKTSRNHSHSFNLPDG